MKGLRLDEFKEPAFSKDVLTFDAKKIYINAVQAESKVEGYKFLYSEGALIKGGSEIAIKELNRELYNKLKIFVTKDYKVREVKYLINEREEATAYNVLESCDQTHDHQRVYYIDGDKDFEGKEPQELSIDEIIQASYQANIIDETDGIYLFEKIRYIKENIRYSRLYIDAIDDQPYSSSKESLIIHYPKALNFVIQTLKRSMKLKEIEVLSYDIEDYNRKTKIPKKMIDTPVIKLNINYPARHYVKKRFHYDGFIGIQAVLHLARLLIDKSYKQTTTFITIAGSGVYEPTNIEVPIGVSVKELLENFKLKGKPKRVIIGEILTGVAISNEEIPISVLPRSVLIFNDYLVLKQMECIGCARCSNVCPQNLLPLYRNKYKEMGDSSLEEFADDSECIKCYCCSYICPSHINLV